MLKERLGFNPITEAPADKAGGPVDSSTNTGSVLDKPAVVRPPDMFPEGHRPIWGVNGKCVGVKPIISQLK